MQFIDLINFAFTKKHHQERFLYNNYKLVSECITLYTIKIIETSKCMENIIDMYIKKKQL